MDDKTRERIEKTCEAYAVITSMEAMVALLRVVKLPNHGRAVREVGEAVQRLRARTDDFRHTVVNKETDVTSVIPILEESYNKGLEAVKEEINNLIEPGRRV